MSGILAKPAASGANVTLTDRRLDVRRESITASGDMEPMMMSPEEEARAKMHILRCGI